MTRTQNIYIGIVDDDESVCRSLSRFLRAAHVQPITYSSAEAFLADTKHPKFDCLLLDVQLGGMSGIELSKQLAAGPNPVPVIFITAHDDPAAQAEADGCAGYFRKTDSGQEVLAAIHRVVGAESPEAAPYTTNSNQ
jgi:FixJ family two-component response regulator